MFSINNEISKSNLKTIFSKFFRMRKNTKFENNFQHKCTLKFSKDCKMLIKFRVISAENLPCSEFGTVDTYFRRLVYIFRFNKSPGMQILT